MEKCIKLVTEFLLVMSLLQLPSISLAENRVNGEFIGTWSSSKPFGPKAFDECEFHKSQSYVCYSFPKDGDLVISTEGRFEVSDDLINFYLSKDKVIFQDVEKLLFFAKVRSIDDKIMKITIDNKNFTLKRGQPKNNKD